MTGTLRLGTRGSPLALWQANHVRGLLAQAEPGVAVELVLIETEGDRVRDRALSQMGGYGVFTKEIQAALLDGRADVAVHSLKDLPTLVTDGLSLAATPARGPAGDAFVSRRFARLDDLPDGATVATSSLRRRSQLLHRRPGLKVADLRGNVETRLRKLEELGLDGIVLAEAGLRRLGLEGHISESLDNGWMLPAVGQGAIGLECRVDDARAREIVGKINHAETWRAATAERAFLSALGGGCLVPIGALCEGDRLRGAVLPVDGSRRIGGEETGGEPVELGRRLAEKLLAAGAGEVLGAMPGEPGA
ncbi:MAG: hydroxymethylbilane synthase [Gemmataceae bacterium]|nr:hydroxymethylbilane synthase [Gemmataceae bacterium]